MQKIANWIASLGPGVKLIGIAILYAVALYYGWQPLTKAMSSIKDKNYSEALGYIGGVIGIFALPVFFTWAAIFGQSVGGEVTTGIGSVIAPMIPLLTE